MYEITNNFINYNCVVCGIEIPNMPVLDETKSMVDGFHGQHLQVLITAKVDHQCDLSKQIADKPATSLTGDPVIYPAENA